MTRNRALGAKRIQQTSPLPPDLGAPLETRPQATIPHKELQRRSQAQGIRPYLIAPRRWARSHPRRRRRRGTQNPRHDPHPR